MKKKRIYILSSFFMSGFLMILFMFLENNSITLLFLLTMFVSIGYLIFYNSNEQQTAINNYIKETDKYIEDNKIVVNKSVYSDTISSRIIFDHENKNIHILKLNKVPIKLPYSKIVESELIENGNTITKTSRGSQLSGAIIGSALTGGIGVGTMVGGLSAKTKSSKEIKKIEIKIIADDLYSPVNSFYIKDSINEYEKDSILYRKLYDSAYELHKTISVIIKNNK